jgi:hypothetical protein
VSFVHAPNLTISSGKLRSLRLYLCRFSKDLSQAARLCGVAVGVGVRVTVGVGVGVAMGVAVGVGVNGGVGRGCGVGRGLGVGDGPHLPVHGVGVGP